MFSFAAGFVIFQVCHTGEYEDDCVLLCAVLCCVVWKKLTDISEVLTASIIRVILTMERKGPLKRLSVSTRLHSATSPNTIIFRFLLLLGPAIIILSASLVF
jgi:hypothetical protein